MGLFNRFGIETPESVELEFNLAGIGNRAYALWLDYLVLGTSLVVILFCGTFLFFFLLELSLITRSENLELWLLAIQLLLIFFLYTGYFVFFETLWQGQTPGKKWTKIRVICDNGTTVGLIQSSLRALLRPIDDILFIGAFLIAFTTKEKRLGDLVAGTIVIKQGSGNKVKEIPLSETATLLATELEKKIEIQTLLPEDFALVREYLQRRQQMLPEAKQQISLELAHKIKDKLNLDSVSPETSSETFLEAVYWAYRQTCSYLPKD